MSRLGERARRRCRTTSGSLALFAALLLVLPAAASACIEDGGGEDRAPTIGGEQVSPTTLTYLGGTVVLTGEVEDDCGIRSVHGEVVNDGFASFFEMHPVGPGSFVNATLYQGEAQLPPNNEGSPVYYFAVMEAEDTNGSIEHAFSGEVEVAAAPASPPTGELVVGGSKTGSFGPVKVGKASTRRLVVRDTGARGDAPIAASITSSGAPFSIRGAVEGKIEFSLKPKETRVFTIEFEPVAAGLATGSVLVARADGAQPSVSVSLTGVGVEPRRRPPG
jgi:hypothetical protein